MIRTMEHHAARGFSLFLIAAMPLVCPGAVVCGDGGSGNAPRIPERPRYPVKMETLSDAEFGRMFFAELNLDYPGLRVVKAAVGKGDYTVAFAEWSKVFMARLQKMKLFPYRHENWNPLDELMTPDRVHMRHGAHVKDFGPVGRMDWYGLKGWLKDWEVHLNCMWHQRAIIGRIEENCGKSSRRIPAKET